jgi:tetratricopeptide (TPR) repeat protein
MGPLTRTTWVLATAASLGLGGVLVAVRGWGHHDQGELAAQVRDALQNRQWPRADNLLKDLARLRSPTAEDIALRAELELGRGHIDQAVNLLTSIPESDPRAARARLLAGKIEKSRDRARAMEPLFLEAIRLDHSLGLARRELIFLYATQARRAELNSQYRALAETEPLHYDEVFFWTNSFENLWINNTIQSHLQRYVAADPEDRISRLALAGVLVRYNQLEDAEALLRAVSDSDPDVLGLRVKIALGRMRLDEVQSLLARAPKDHVGLALLRAQSAVRQNDPSAAAGDFRLVLRHDPDNREALQGLALVLHQLGDHAAAAAPQKQADQWRHLTSLLQKSKTFEIRDDKVLLGQIGAACEDLGQLPEARAWYRLALTQDPLDTAIQKSLYRVRGNSRPLSPLR